MSYYSLLPGTNQLIEKNGTQGTNLFRKHGYNVRNPNHYHYYNMLRGPQRDSFFDDLASILGGVAKVWGATANTGVTRGSSINLSGSTTANSIANAGSSSPFQMGSIPAKSDIGFSGFMSSMNGHERPSNAAGRNAAYLELVNHFRNESIRHNYMNGEPIFTYYQAIPQVYSIGMQTQNTDQSQEDSSGQSSDKSTGDDSSGSSIGDLFTNIRTPLFIIGGIILALIIWQKIR
jgi:hypothetical protein